MTYSVSVVIAAYNASLFLRRSVRSALNQTVPPLEVLIIDDFSTDDTVAVAHELSTADQRVRVITSRANGGPSVARNAGLASAQGDWVAILDADDEIDANHLSVLTEVAAFGHFDVVLGNFVYCNPLAPADGDMPAAGLAQSGPVDVIDAAYYVSHCAGEKEEADWGLLKPLFSVNFLRVNGIQYPTKSRHGEDFLLIVELLMSGAKVGISRRPTYRYTLRSFNWSRTRIDYQLMIEHTRFIGLDERVSNNSSMKVAVQNRIIGIRNLVASRKIAAGRADGKKIALFLELITDRFVLYQLVKMASRKAANLFRRTMHRNE